jgi:hypothetical protein
MYGTFANRDPTKEREQIRESKRETIANLLTNKFRNRFDVNPVTEPNIDQIIVDHVHALLKKGNAYEASLFELEKKLDQ